jgi:ankyrin repeat protein
VEDAKKKLKGLKDDNTHAHDLYQRLEAGYQRLWDLNALVGYESRRIRLFQFVLGSSTLVTTEILTEVLRIQKCTYTKEVNRRDVELLYANFLHDTPSQGIQFVHNSARKFVLNMKVKNAAGEDSEREQFSEKESHMSIARLYIEIMSCSSHPFWQHLGIDPSNWTDVYLDPKKMDRLQHDFNTWYGVDDEDFDLFREDLHSYLAIYGFRHCFTAAQKRSMFDGLWTEVLDRVILSPESAFGYVTLLQPTFANPNSEKPVYLLNRSHLLRLHHGRLELLYSHCLAFLDIIDRDDLARLQLGESSIEVGSEKDRQRRLFEHVACKGVSSESLALTIHSRIQPGDQTALHIALWRRNAAAVEMILQAALVLSEFRCVAGMLSKPRRGNSPLSMAILDSQFPLAEKLLLWERKWWEKSEAYEPARPFVTSQWSAKDEKSGRTALSLAIQHFTEDQTCHLLSLVRPDDSNMLDEKPIPRNTPLHIAAAYGYLQLVTDLVEKYGADSLAINSRMETPAFCAFQFYRKNVLEYLGGKGDTGDFDLSSRPKRPPTARDLEEWMFLGWIDPEIEISRRERTMGCSTPGKAGFIRDIELIKGIKDEKKLALAKEDHWYHSGGYRMSRN